MKKIIKNKIVSHSTTKKKSHQSSIAKHPPTTHLWKLGNGKIDKSRILVTGWNVNGFRSVRSKNKFIPFIEQYEPDFICLNQTKIDFQGYKKEVACEKVHKNYYQYWNFCKVSAGYSGVLVLTPHLPISVVQDFPTETNHSLEGRLLTLQYQTFYLVNVYKPNSGGMLQRLNYRVNEYDVFFNNHIKDLLSKKSVIIFGDMNVAHHPIDLAHPKANQGKACFTIQQRDRFSELLDGQLKDTFRYLHPQEQKYSFWSYRTRARERNVGWRLDYILASNNLKVLQANILSDIEGSDHCPISALIQL